VAEALAGYQQAAIERSAATDPARLAETIMLRERERSRRQRERGSALDADIGDLLLDGVCMLWETLP
jgi:hypothetical protein